MNKQDKKQPEGKRLQRQMKITSIVFTERRHCIQETRRYIIQENVHKLKSLGFQTESTQVSTTVEENHTNAHTVKWQKTLKRENGLHTKD